jgi:signal transduction histidine kinase/CheY-like chemotaxis protein
MTTELASFTVRDLTGVFAARQLGRELAAGLALDRQDQIRVATALSEISRSTVTSGLEAVIVFGADHGDLVLTVTLNGEPGTEGVEAAARLMDKVGVSGSVIKMTKRRPTTVAPDMAAIGRQLAAMLPQTTMDELRRNNQDLISALDDLKEQKEQLLLLNAELQETNHGVMALYQELSEELEQTNRGVVALYAELDEKSEQLRLAAESKDRFWANISHELRTPLNSTLGLTRLLAEPADPADGAQPGAGRLGAEQLYQVELIRNSTTTLLGLVNDLLDVAKAESGRLSIEPALVNLPALLSTLRGLSRPMTDGKPVSLVVDAAAAPATILTDELALTAILRNLLSNGIKYTDSGEVKLAVRETGGRLEISVADSGTGIPARLQERVFEEFYQVPGARRGGGTGLGLPYARRLAHLIGAELTLTSKPSVGTTVVLSLPHGMPALGTVVVADDDAGFRQVLRAMLAGITDRVVEAGDGEQALAAIADSGADLVLTDLRMPGMDGYALLGQLPSAIPAIVITGLDEPPPTPAAAQLRKDELTRERLAFTIRAIGAIRKDS